MQTDMATEQEYRTRAKECIELAITARTTEQRIMLQHIASTWVRLADDAAQMAAIQCCRAACTPRRSFGFLSGPRGGPAWHLADISVEPPDVRFRG